MSRSSMTENGHHGIPEATVNRLPVYLRALYALADRGIATVSSEELAAAAGVNSAKLRKDLSHLGSYGTRGVGTPGGIDAGGLAGLRRPRAWHNSHATPL